MQIDGLGLDYYTGAEKILFSHKPVYVSWCLNIHGHDHNCMEHYKEGVLSDISSIHRITIDGAMMRKKVREESGG